MFFSWMRFSDLASGLARRRWPRHSSTSPYLSSTSTSPATSTSPYLATTPIFYVNSVPHIGHLYTALLADTHARYTQLSSPSRTPHLLATGTDEHGLKVQQAAAARGLEPQSLCDEVSATFRQVFDRFGIGYTDYIRTTEPRHARAVAAVWGQLEERGHLYRDTYSGWYSVQDEAFLPPGQVEEREGGHYSLESGHKVEWQEETNWMFRLVQHRPALLAWLRDQRPVQPDQFTSQVLAWLEDPDLGDLSVSRPRHRLSWGLPVPGDPDQTVYVWLDALVNYLTVAGYPDTLQAWPPDLQVLGKDILKFHTIYWPAILLSLELPLPPRLHVHSHWTVEGVKMSKSLGNVLCPNVLAESYTEEGLRYFLLREGVAHTDGSFCCSSLVHLCNLELGDTLGNLLSRATSNRLNPRQVRPSTCLPPTLTPTSAALWQQLEEVGPKVSSLYGQLSFHSGIVAVMDVLRATNGLVQEEAPWSSEVEQDRREWVLALVLESLRVCGVLLQPVVPGIAARLLGRLGAEGAAREWSSTAPSLPSEEAPLGQEVGALFVKVKLAGEVSTEKEVKPVKPKKTRKTKG